MKVFEVICEYCKDGSEEMVTVQQYVTSEEDTLKSVADHFVRHCLECKQPSAKADGFVSNIRQ